MEFCAPASNRAGRIAFPAPIPPDKGRSAFPPALPYPEVERPISFVCVACRLWPTPSLANWPAQMPAAFLGFRMSAMALYISLIGVSFAADLNPGRATFDERFGNWRAVGVFVWMPAPNATSRRD